MLKLNFSPFPLLQTERLTLRKINIEDAEGIFALRSDDRVNQFIDRPKAHSVEDARNFINQIRNRGSNNELLYWAITQKKNGDLIGTIVFWNISPEEERAEVGFELLPDYQGQGLMKEALLRVIDYGFNQLGLHMIEALPEEHNEKSLALLEKTHFVKDDRYNHAFQNPESNFKTVRFTLLNAR
ncbi:MAG: GNAT family N-acetyltransferase [Chitinophagaceae bacterium]|nr:GNAT family N-acetyltransferase [Chitinophagaceae bacterium]